MPRTPSGSCRISRTLHVVWQRAPSDDGASVVFVETVEGETVTEESRHLMERLTSHLEVHLGRALGYSLCGARN
jgi:hypothetical protein